MAWELSRGARVRPTRPGLRLSVEPLESRELLAAFTPGNLVIYRVGDGAAALGNASAAVFLDEYTPSGTLVQSVALPTSDPDGAGPQRALTSSGNSTSEGSLTRSTNGTYLLIPGYDTPTGTATVASTSSGTVRRVVGRVAADGTFDTSTALGASGYDGSNIRSVASTNGTDIWTAGTAAATANGGVRYTTFGSDASVQLSSTVTNTRTVHIFDGQLYVGHGSGSTGRPASVGTGLPTTTGQTINSLAGLPTSGSTYNFFFADLDAGVAGVDTVYVANDDAGALRKFSLVAGTWTLNGTVGVTADGYRGLTASVSGTTVTLYAVRDNGSGADTIVSLVDTSGYNGALTGTPTLLATAATNTAFRGVAFTPESGTAPNTAPSLDNSGNTTLTAIDEDATTNTGDLVGAIIASAGGNRITDPDAGAVEGIAVVGVDNSNGAWQFSTNGGTDWTPFGTPSPTSARLLADNATTRIRFVPGPNFNGTVNPGVTFHAWDRTSGTNGGTADVSTNGGTTAFSTATETASIVVNAVNDAPVLDNSGTMTLTTLTEDDPPTAGDLVTAILTSAGGDRITDADAGAAEGIAVTAVDSANGTWEYTLNGGANWTPFGSPSATTARLLAADANTRIRFLPNANFTGTVAAGITFRAWDQTTGTVGGTADVTTNGGATAFSTAEETAAVTVLNINDAPLLDNSANLSLAAINEDPGTNPGDLVGAILASGGNPISDIDPAAVEGIAVVGVDNSNGAWQFSTNGGTDWTPFGTPSPTSARLLADNATTRIRFVPGPNFNGSVGTGITFHAWDQTTGTNGGTADASTNGGTTAFSTATETASIVVNAVNDAPVLENSGTMTLATITVNEFSNSGTLVTDLVASAGGNRITDADTGALEGIAVFTVDNSNGTWEFTLDGGTNWTPFGTPLATAARLLPADALTRVRFVPDLDFTGTVAPGITFRAWDQTSGTPGGTASLAANGGATAFSTAVETASITISPVNDAPVLDNTGAMSLTDVIENTFNPAGDLIEDVIASAGGDRVTDINPGAVEGIAVIAADNTNGSWQFSIDNGANWAPFGTPSVGSARLLAANGNTRVRFVPNAGFTGTVDPGLTFHAWDQASGLNGFTADVTTTGGTTAFSVATETASVEVREINVAPTLDNTGTMTLAAIDEDVITSPGTLVTDLIASAGGDRITDPNTGAVEGIAVIAVDNANGVWHFTTNGGLNWIPFGPTTSATARLLAADADTRIRFVPNADFNGTVTGGLTFRAWDRTEGFNGNVFEITATGGMTPFSTDTETASITVNPINDAPTLDNGGSMAMSPLTEDLGANPGDSVIDVLNSAGGDRITDIDAGAVEGIAVTAVNNTNGTWEYSTNGGTDWVAFGAPTDTAARLLAATATNRIRFVPNAGFSGTLVSGLSFRAWDQTTGTGGSAADVTANGGTTAFSAAVETVEVTVNPVNDAPVLDGSGTMFLSVLTEDPVTNPGTLVSDVLASAGGDRITDVDAGALEGIAVTFADNGNGIWQYSLNGGATWTPFGIPSVADARLLAADANTRVRFVPNADFNGTIATGLTFVAWDRTTGTNGGSADVTVRGGSTAFSLATASAGIAVNAVNDGPVNVVPVATQTVQGDNSLVFSGANGISVTDGDAGVGSLRVTLTATNGVLKLSGTLGLSFTTGDGDGDATMTFTGTRAAINAALAGMTYRPNNGFTGAATVQILTNDQGNSGSGTALADGDTVNITVTPAPVSPTTPPLSSSTPLSAPELFTQYARIGRGRVRLLRFGLVNPLPVPLRLFVRIPLRRLPGTKRLRFITGVVTINAGETAADFVFRITGTPTREPLRLANVEVNDTRTTVQQTLGF